MLIRFYSFLRHNSYRKRNPIVTIVNRFFNPKEKEFHLLEKCNTFTKASVSLYGSSFRCLCFAKNALYMTALKWR